MRILALPVIALTLIASAAQAQGVERINRSYQEAPSLPLGLGLGLGASKAPATDNQWTIKTEDRTVRRVVERWSQQAGWTFGTEHWAVESDLPVMAGASVKGDFRAAIRTLLSSSELTDTPLQPCFYSNGVLRVIPRAEKCDRMAVEQ